MHHHQRPPESSSRPLLKSRCLRTTEAALILIYFTMPTASYVFRSCPNVWMRRRHHSLLYSSSSIITTSTTSTSTTTTSTTTSLFSTTNTDNTETNEGVTFPPRPVRGTTGGGSHSIRSRAAFSSP